MARLLYGDMDGRGLGRRARRADRGSVVGATTAAAVADCKDWTNHFQGTVALLALQVGKSQ